MKLLFRTFIRVRTNDCSRFVRIVKDMKDMPSLMQPQHQVDKYSFRAQDSSYETMDDKSINARLISPFSRDRNRSADVPITCPGPGCCNIETWTT